MSPTPNDPDIYRDLGSHDAEIRTLKAEVHALRGDVAEIKQMLSEARGGWKTMMAVAGLSSSLGAMLSYMVTKFPGIFR